MKTILEQTLAKNLKQNIIQASIDDTKDTGWKWSKIMLRKLQLHSPVIAFGY